MDVTFTHTRYNTTSIPILTQNTWKLPLLSSGKKDNHMDSLFNAEFLLQNQYDYHSKELSKATHREDISKA